MTPIIDGNRLEFSSGPIVEFICPECKEPHVQPVRKCDDEGSLVGMMPHDGCKSAEILIRIR